MLAKSTPLQIEKAEFSNAILEGYLKFIDQKSDQNTRSLFIKKVSALGVNEEWLRDKREWHTADFHEKLLKIFHEVLPHEKNLSFDCAFSLFSDNKIQRFTAFAGLLLKPNLFFSKLPSAAERMNIYNTYIFNIEKRRLGFTRAKLTQNYHNLERKDLNSYLCNASRGSIFGIMKFFGYQIIEFKEDKCVNKGDSCCEFVFSWINRAIFTELTLFFSIGFVIYFLLSPVALDEQLKIFLSFLTTLTISAVFTCLRYHKRFAQVFDYQQIALMDQRQSIDKISRLNSQLLSYQKQVNEVMHAVSLAEHSYSVFHDMASPLFILSMSISQLSEKIQSKDSDQSEKSVFHLCDTIEKATNNLVVLQNVFRSFADVNLEGKKIELDIQQIIGNCIDMFSLLCNQYKIDIKFIRLPYTLKIFAIGGLMESICINLIQNAIKALRVHPYKRELNVGVVEKDSLIEIFFQDSGPGIPEEKLHSIWQKKSHFSKSTSSLKEVFAFEKGIGLPFLKEILEKNNGNIECESHPTGTTFIVTLPKT